MIEVLTASLVLVIGVVGTFSTIDGVRRLGTLGEKKQTAARYAQHEIENLRSRGWAALQMDAAPAAFSDTRGTGTATTYAPPRGGAAQDYVIAASCPTTADCVASAPSTWSYGNVSGQVHRYVTYSHDALCGSACPNGSVDHKRVTVAVTVNAPDAPKAAIVISTIVIDPAAAPANATQNANPVASTGGNSIGAATGTTYYLTDTPAGTTYAAPSNNHAAHDTVGASGVPDQLRTSAPDPPLSGQPAAYLYATDVGGGSDGGRGIEGSSGCAGTNRKQAQVWVTPALSAGSAVTATGNAAFSLPTSALNPGAVQVGGRLCIDIYDVSLNGSNQVASSTHLGSFSYALPQWPQSTELVAVPFRYMPTGTTASIAPGRRLAVRMAADAAVSSGLVIVYDHPNFPGYVQLETQ